MQGFQDAQNAMMNDLKNDTLKGDESSTSSTDNKELAPATSSTEGRESQAPEQSRDLSRSEQIELDKLEKFKFGGEEWTPATLKAAMLRQQDYTKKTQETAQERKYLDNYKRDLETVRSNPNLASEFKKIYPPQYHYLVDSFLSTSDAETEQPKSEQNQSYLNDPKLKELMHDVTELKTFNQAQATKAATQEIDATLRELVAKHNVPEEARADIELVTLKKIEELISFNKENPDRRVEITSEIWAKAYEQTYKNFNRTMEAIYKQKVQSQTNASKKAKDTGAGGGTPGQAPVKTSLKDVRQQMLNDIKTGKAMAN